MAKLISKNQASTIKKCKEKLSEIDISANEEKFEIANVINCDVALVYLASISGTIAPLKKLIDSGFPFNCPLKTSPEACPILHNYSGYTALHYAFKYQSLNTLQFLLSQGANIFIPDDRGITPLHIFFETKKKILQEQTTFEFYDQVIDIIMQIDEQKFCNMEGNQMSQFHIACTRDQPEIIQNFLCKNELCINQPVDAFLGHEGFSPLHLALTYKCNKVVKLLLNSGANVNQVNRNNRAALHLTDSPDLAQLLLQQGADFTLQDSDSNTPLHKAFEERNFKMIDLLLTAQLNNNANPTNAIGISHFHIACARNNENIVKQFLNHGVSINSCVPIDSEIEYTCYWDDLDWCGCSPLHFAVAFNQSKVVKLLLSKDANVRTKDARGFTALHLACRNMHEKIEELLMESLRKHKDEGSVSSQGTTGKNWIDWTSNRRDHLDIIKMLLKSICDVNCHDNFGNTPVYCAYAFHALVNFTFLEKYQKSATDNFLWEMHYRRKVILELLLQHPVDLDTCYENGPILHHIIKETKVPSAYFLDALDHLDGLYDVVGIFEMFLRHSASVDALNQRKITPLFQALQTKVQRLELIDILIEYGANLNFCEPEKHSSILHVAWSHSPKIFHQVLRKGADPNAKSLDGTTVMHCVARAPYLFTELMNLLVELGANVNARNAEGRTPLFYACLSLNYEIAKILLDNGADINIEDNKGKTVLTAYYEEMLMNEKIELIFKKKKDEETRKKIEIVRIMSDVLLDYVRERKSTVSQKVLFSREKIIDYYFSNILFAEEEPTKKHRKKRQ